MVIGGVFFFIVDLFFDFSTPQNLKEVDGTNEMILNTFEMKRQT